VAAADADDSLELAAAGQAAVEKGDSIAERGVLGKGAGDIGFDRDRDRVAVEQGGSRSGAGGPASRLQPSEQIDFPTDVERGGAVAEVEHRIAPIVGAGGADAGTHAHHRQGGIAGEAELSPRLVDSGDGGSEIGVSFESPRDQRLELRRGEGLGEAGGDGRCGRGGDRCVPPVGRQHLRRHRKFGMRRAGGGGERGKQDRIVAPGHGGGLSGRG
jgi:hypothetical protein